MLTRDNVVVVITLNEFVIPTYPPYMCIYVSKSVKYQWRLTVHVLKCPRFPLVAHVILKLKVRIYDLPVILNYCTRLIKLILTFFALFSWIAGRTMAAVTSHFINARGIVLTGIRGTVIYVWRNSINQSIKLSNKAFTFAKYFTTEFVVGTHRMPLPSISCEMKKIQMLIRVSHSWLCWCCHRSRWYFYICYKRENMLYLLYRCE